jgi:hypothetical protein
MLMYHIHLKEIIDEHSLNDLRKAYSLHFSYPKLPPLIYSLLQSLVAPLCVMEVTELLWLQLKKPQMTSPPGLLGTVLLLSGISSQKVVLISSCIHMLTKVVQDTCIYFFTFVTFHAILEWQENIQHNS